MRLVIPKETKKKKKKMRASRETAYLIELFETREMSMYVEEQVDEDELELANDVIHGCCAGLTTEGDCKALSYCW